MKNFLFVIFVIIMTPIYLLVCIFRHALQLLIEFTNYFVEPIVDGVIEITNNMIEFWEKVFKRRGG